MDRYEAEKWLRDIHNYIAQDNPTAAQKIVSAIYEKAQLLKNFPEIGYKYKTDCLSHQKQGFDRYFRHISWRDGNRQIFKMKFVLNDQANRRDT